MKDFKIPTARNLETGEEKSIDIDPRSYTSVHEWKPVPPERFAQLLHQYQCDDHNSDDYGNGLMHAKAFKLDRETTAIIHYSIKRPGSSIASPVLMTIDSSKMGKVICFASLLHGREAPESVSFSVGGVRLDR